MTPKTLLAPPTLLAVLAVALLSGILLDARDAPFDTSKAGIVSADDFAYTLRAFETHGAFALGFQPVLFFLPTTREGLVPFVSHPILAYAGYYGFQRVCGPGEGPLRVLSLLLIVGGVVGTAACLRPPGGGPVPGVAAALLALAPAVIVYGDMVDMIPWTFALIPWCVWAWMRFRDGGRLLTYAAVAFAAGLASWYAYFVVLALWADLLFFDRRPGRFRTSPLLAGLPFLASLLCYLAYWSFTMGGFGGMVDHFRLMLSKAAGNDAFAEAGEDAGVSFGSTILDNLTSVHGAVLVAAAFGAMVLLLRRRGGTDVRTARAAWMILLAGAFTHLVFWSRSASHPFLMMTLAPGLAALAAIALVFISDGLRREAARAASWQAWVLPVLAVALLALQVRAGLATRERHGGNDAREIGRLLGSTFDATDVVLMPTQDYRSGLRYYTPTGLVIGPWSPAGFAFYRDNLRPARSHIRKLWIACSPESLHAVTSKVGAPHVPILPGTSFKIPVGNGRVFLVSGVDIDAFFGT